MKTAVEWLLDYMDNNQYFIGNDLLKAVEQAKEMEMEQYKETFKQSRKANIFELDMPPVWESWKQYYNETFNL